jgi:pimeloyl-ACP methyl ester carboxylesterase
MPTPAKMRRVYIDGPYGQLHVLDAVEGRPVLLLHQAIMTAHQFDRVFAPLIARGLRPIAIDMPGFGQSDPPPFVPAIRDYAAVVPALLDALGLARVPIVGHHTGALVANEAALDFPARVSAVILGGALLIDEAQRRSAITEMVAREKAFEALPGAAHMVQFAELREHFAAGSIGPARIGDYVLQAMSALQHGAYWYGHNAAFAYRHEERLLALTQPTLILSNTGDPLHEASMQAHRLRPDFGFVALEGGGIDIVDQQPQAWADAVADFLVRIPDACSGQD